jgi:APA family basic amino acid/polyamine antiporter
MLGIGIFITPPQVAASVPSSGWFFAVWLLGGVVAACGALSLAELGAMLPRTGGDYAYLQRAYGPGVAFAAGWLQLLAIFPGSIASIAVATSQYQLPLLVGDAARVNPEIFGVTLSAPHVWAAALILALTCVNLIGVRTSGIVQVIVTIIPIAILAVLAVALIFADVAPIAPSPTHAAPSGAPQVAASSASSAPSGIDVWALARAYLAVYFAYSGWNAAIYVGEEIRDPPRNLPRALVGGTLSVTVLYLVLCAGFLAIFPLEVLAGVGEAGTAATVALLGDLGVLVMGGLVFLAMLGSINGSIFTGSRIGEAMAHGGDCFRACAHVSPRTGVPVNALLLQSALALGLVATGQDLGKLIDYTSSAMLVTGTLTVMSVVVFRARHPEWARPYRTTFYPLPPLLFATSSALALGIGVLGRDPSVAVAVAWFVLALLLHRMLWRRAPASASARDE